MFDTEPKGIVKRESEQHSTLIDYKDFHRGSKGAPIIHHPAKKRNATKVEECLGDIELRETGQGLPTRTHLAVHPPTAPSTTWMATPTADMSSARHSCIAPSHCSQAPSPGTRPRYPVESCCSSHSSKRAECPKHSCLASHISGARHCVAWTQSSTATRERSKRRRRTGSSC